MFVAVRAEPPRAAGWLARSLAGWRCEIRRALLPVAVISAISAAATAASPVLLAHPLVLAGLSPRLPFLAVAAADTPVWLFLVVALPRSLLTDPIYFGIGRRHGAAALALLPGKGGRLARIAALSAPLLVLVRPVGRHLLLAGAGRSRTWAVVVADLVGTATYLLLLHAASNAL